MSGEEAEAAEGVCFASDVTPRGLTSVAVATTSSFSLKGIAGGSLASVSARSASVVVAGVGSPTDSAGDAVLTCEAGLDFRL